MTSKLISFGDEHIIKFGISVAIEACFTASFNAGWWNDPQTGQPFDRTRSEIKGMKIALIHSEISEALEGERKNSMDSHLPARRATEVELADAIIRIFDYAGAFNLDLGGALIEKLAYNASRADHKIANRNSDGGKKF